MGDGDANNWRTLDVEYTQILLHLYAPDGDNYTKYQYVLVHRNNAPGGVASEWVMIGPDWEVENFNLAGRQYDQLERAGRYPQADIDNGTFTAIDSDQQATHLIPALQRCFTAATNLGYQNLPAVAAPAAMVWVVVDVRDAAFGQQLNAAEIPAIQQQNGMGTVTRNGRTVFVKQVVTSNLIGVLNAFRPPANADIRMIGTST